MSRVCDVYTCIASCCQEGEQSTLLYLTRATYRTPVDVMCLTYTQDTMSRVCECVHIHVYMYVHAYTYMHECTKRYFIIIMMSCCTTTVHVYSIPKHNEREPPGTPPPSESGEVMAYLSCKSQTQNICGAYNNV